MYVVTAVTLSLTLTACGDDGHDHPDASSPVVDAASADAATTDAACTTCTADAATADASTTDASAIDAMVPDATTTDAMITTRSFSQGVAGYTGTQDTTLLLAQPTSSFGTLSAFAWDADGSFGLLRFDSIFGSGATQIPAGSTIVSATLTIEIANDSDVDAALHNVLVPWNEATATYNNLGATAGVSVGEDYSAAVVSAVPPTGTLQLDVTSSVATWSASPSTNRGWLFLTASADGGAANSSEATSARPILTVSFTP